MAAEQRKLLEQLMGDQLMSLPGATKQAALTLTDAKVCRSYLCGSCPHDLFTNTKQDLGACPKAHQPNLKEEYQALSDEKKKELGFEFDYKNDINKYVAECDRTSPSKNSTNSNSQRCRRTRRNVSLRISPTHPDPPATRSCRCAMFVEPICHGWTTIGVWRITFLGRCIWGMRRCEGIMRGY